MMGYTSSLDGYNTNAHREDLGKVIGNRILVGQRRQYKGAVDEKEKLRG
jgi:hypothetical protein